MLAKASLRHPHFYTSKAIYFWVEAQALAIGREVVATALEVALSLSDNQNDYCQTQWNLHVSIHSNTAFSFFSLIKKPFDGRASARRIDLEWDHCLGLAGAIF
jgi:hypothetical protein